MGTAAAAHLSEAHWPHILAIVPIGSQLHKKHVLSHLLQTTEGRQVLFRLHLAHF